MIYLYKRIFLSLKKEANLDTSIEGLMLSERSWTQEDRYCMTPPRWGIESSQIQRKNVEWWLSETAGERVMRGKKSAATSFIYLFLLSSLDPFFLATNAACVSPCLCPLNWIHWQPVCSTSHLPRDSWPSGEEHDGFQCFISLPRRHRQRQTSQPKDLLAKLQPLSSHLGLLSKYCVCCQALASIVHWPAASALPGNLLEMQNLGFHPVLWNHSLHFDENPQFRLYINIGKAVG